MTEYATAADLRTRLGIAAEDPWPNSATEQKVARYLRLGSELVADATVSAVYSVDTAGLPTEQPKAAAMREAALDMAEAWVLSGIDPALGTNQLKRAVKQKSLSGGGASVTYDSADSGQVVLAQGDALLERAARRLWRAGLVSTAVGTLPAGRDTHIVGTEYRLGTGELLP